MRPQIAARVIEDDVDALPNAIAGHGVRKLRGRGHHEGQGAVPIREVLHEVGEPTARNMAVCPGLTAIGNLEPVGISGKHDGAIQDTQIGVIEMCFEPSCFDQILRIDECHRTPPCVSLPYSDELTPNAGRQARLEAGARDEQTLEAVACTPGVRPSRLRLPPLGPYCPWPC